MNSLRTIRTVVLIPLALVACGTAQIPATPIDPGVRLSPRPRVTLRTAYLPLLVGLTPAGEEPQLLLGWNARYLIEADRWRVAPGLMSGEIVAAAEMGEHWFFASSAGVIASSEGPGGVLSHIVDTPVRLTRGPLGGAFGSEGRFAAVHGPGSLRSSGRLPLLSDPPSSVLYSVNESGALDTHEFEHAVTRAVFASATRGAVILDSGQVFMTEDGGVRWSEAGVEGELARDLRLDDDGLIQLVTTRGVRPLQPSPSGARMNWSVGIERSGQTAGLRTIIEARTRMDRGAAGPQEMLWAEAGLRIVVRERSLFRVDARSGSIRAAHTRALPTNGCRPHPFGAGVAITCEGWAATIAESEAALVPLMEAEEGATFVDFGGRFLVHDQPCTTDAARGSWCRVNPDGTRATFTPSEPLAEAFGVAEGRLVGVVRRGDDRSELVSVNVASGMVAPIAGAPMLDARSANQVRLVADGAILVATTAAGDRESSPRVWMGSLSEAMQRLRLPPEAAGVGFIDAQRGVAYGRSAAELWSTVNGGLSWEPLEAELLGDASTQYLNDLRPEFVAPLAECDASGCLLERTLQARWDDVAQSRSDAIVRRSTAPPYPELVDAAARHHLPPPLRRPCGRLGETSTRAEGEFRLVAGVTMNCTATAQGAPWHCSLRGSRVTTYGLTSRAFELPLPPPSGGGTAQGMDDGFRVIAAGESGLVLKRNTNGDEQFVWLRADGPVWLAALRDSALLGSRTPRPLPSESWLVHEESVYRLVRFERAWATIGYASDGQIEVVSEFVTDNHSAWLATRDGQAGAVTPSAAHGEHLFWPVGSRRPRRFRTPWRDVLDFCPESPGPSSNTLVIPSPSLRDAHGASSMGLQLHAIVAWSDDTACVQEMHRTEWELLRGVAAPLPSTWRVDGEQQVSVLRDDEQRRCGTE